MKMRPAAPEDREGILAIASETWEGWDYVPLFIDRWIGEGGLYVVSDEQGRIIGMTKTTEISAGELWLEAIRVDPNRREKGLGTQIAAEQLRLAIEQKPRSIRLSTADKNTASFKIIRHLGFCEYAIYNFYRLGESIQYDQALDYGQVKTLGPSDTKVIASAWKLITSSEEYRVSKGLFPRTWKFSNWTEELFRAQVGQGVVYVTPQVSAVLVLVPNRYAPQGLEIAFLDGQDPQVSLLGHFALKNIGSCSDREYRSSGFAASDRKHAIYASLGIEPREDLKTVYVFNYPLTPQ